MGDTPYLLIGLVFFVLTLVGIELLDRLQGKPFG
jgi:hypothetical protein